MSDERDELIEVIQRARQGDTVDRMMVAAALLRLAALALREIPDVQEAGEAADLAARAQDRLRGPAAALLADAGRGAALTA